MEKAPDEAVLDALLDATSDGVVVVDATGDVVATNDAMGDLVGRPLERIRGAAWTDLFDGTAPDLASLADTGDETTASPDAADVTSNALVEDGLPVAVSCRRAAEYLVATVSDRTDTVERDRFERILENVDDGIYLLDADGRIEYINEAAIEAHGMTYDRDEMIGKFASAVLSAEDLEACIDAIRSLIVDADADSEQVAVTIQDADDSEIPAELNLSLLPPENGTYSGSVGVLRDVEERRRRDQMLRVLNRVLRHNLRNDMNVVVGTTQRIQTEHPSVDDEYTDRIERVAEDLVEVGGKARVVEDLTGEGASAVQPVDVVPIVEHVLETVPGPDEHGSITLDVPESATAAVPPMFETAVENVVENALEHCDDPSVAVAVECENDTVTIRVEDDGPGIPDVEIEALRSETETPLEHASGLGLWLTDWIVEFADGDVTYDVDDGTTVTIALSAAT